MISPHVRRIRLGAELLALRREQDWTAQRLADLTGVKRQSISRLENGHGATDVDLVMRILHLAGVDDQRWNTVVGIARQAAERGWWKRDTDAMGTRQALYANLEAGAASIVEYQMAFMPGLLQLPAYTQARIDIDRAHQVSSFNPAKALQARQKRQQMLHRPGGPSYDVVIDELAIRRPATPPHIARDQLDQLVEIGHNSDRVTIRVLPLSAAIDGFTVPRSAFSIYHYPDPGDPIVVAVDTVTSDLILTADTDTAGYQQLAQRLADAALSPAESLDWLAATAEQSTTKGTRNEQTSPA